MSYGIHRVAYVLLAITGLFALSDAAPSKPKTNSALQAFIDALPEDRPADPTLSHFKEGLLGYRPLAATALSTFQNLERQFVIAMGTLGATVQDMKTWWIGVQAPATQLPDRTLWTPQPQLNPSRRQAPQRRTKTRSVTDGCGSYGNIFPTTVASDICGGTDATYCTAQLYCEGRADLSTCPVINVSCPGGAVNAYFQQNVCTLYTLECGGSVVNATQLSGMDNVSGCAVKQVFCDDSDTILDFSGPGESTACPNHPSVQNLTCVDACIQNTTVDQCVCVMERMGQSCDEARPFTCNFTLLEPKKVCDPLQYAHLDEEPACFTDLSVHESVAFTYLINCEFTDTTGLELSIQHKDSPKFSYAAIRDNFGVSTHSLTFNAMQLQMKFYNFNRFIDDRATFYTSTLTARQIVGIALAAVNVSFPMIPDAFFAGNRLYVETGLRNMADSSTDDVLRLKFTNVFDKHFIDLQDVNIHRHVSDDLSSNEVTWIIIFSVGGAFLLLVLVYWVNGKLAECREQRNARKLEKLE